MIRWIETEKGKQPFTLAQVIRHEPEGPNKASMIFFKVYPYDTLLLMDLEPLFYEAGNKYYRLVGKDRMVWINTQSWASKHYNKSKGKNLDFNKHGGVIHFSGKVIQSGEDLWVDANIPIQIMNVHEKLPEKEEYIQKETGGLRVANIIPIEDANIKVDKKEIDKIKAIKAEIPEVWKEQTEPSKEKTQTKKYPEGHFVKKWTGIGIAIFSGLGIPISIFTGNPALIGVGPAIGVGIGIAIGQNIENRYKKEGKIRQLTKKEQEKKTRTITIALLIIGAILFAILLSKLF